MNNRHGFDLAYTERRPHLMSCQTIERLLPEGSLFISDSSGLRIYIPKKAASGLPPIESTVRIVPGDVKVWPDAEQFIGADCTLKAVFMTGDMRMVAVEHIENRVCCCFWAEMVRTPEQAAAEEMGKVIAEMMAGLDPFEQMAPLAVAEFLYAAGYRKQVKP